MRNSLFVFGLSAVAGFVMAKIYGVENAMIVIPSMIVGQMLGFVISATGGRK